MANGSVFAIQWGNLLDAFAGAAEMTDLTFGILIGAGGMFLAMVALILLVNHGPEDPAWRDYEDED